MINLQDCYYNAAQLIAYPISEILQGIDPVRAREIEEIRLRAGRPLSVFFGGKIYFVDKLSQLSHRPDNAIIVDSPTLTKTVKNICGSSVYSHTDEIMNGFISMEGGCRAGIVGVFRQGRFGDISSVNIRIARECHGVAADLIKGYHGGSVLICGPAGCGKTTFLRSLVRGVSNGECGRPYKVSLVDTRFELAAAVGGVPACDIGVNTDVISGREKAAAIEAALRSMSPEIIAFDEIGTTQELEGVKNSLNCGAFIFTTAHISSPIRLLQRGVTKALIEGGYIDKVVFLSSVGASPYEITVKDGTLCGL